MSVELQYAPAHRRRRIRWRWVFLALLLIATVPLWRYGSAIIAHAELRWTLGQCRTYTLPANAVAIEANPAQAVLLLTPDTPYRSYPSRDYVPWGGASGVYRSVPPWEALPPALRPPPRARRFPFYLSTATPIAMPLFLHERLAKDRPARLVAIDLDPEGLRGCVINPGRPWEKPTLVWQGPVRNLGESIPEIIARGVSLSPNVIPDPGESWNAALDRANRQAYANQPPARIYFGQIDPADSSKFSFRVEVSKAEFTFVGQLMPDDTIQIEGPLLSEVFEKLGPPNKR
jgi:hypothetical protein